MQNIPREQFVQLLKETKPAHVAAYRLWLRIHELLAIRSEDYPKDRDKILARTDFEALRKLVRHAKADIGDQNGEKLWLDQVSFWTDFQRNMNKRSSAEQWKAKLATDAFEVCAAFGHGVALILFEIKDGWRLYSHPLARARLLLGVVEHKKLETQAAELQSIWNGISVQPITDSTESLPDEQTSRGSVEVLQTKPASIIGALAEERTDTTSAGGNKRWPTDDEGNTIRSAKRFCPGGRATAIASYPDLDAQGQHPNDSHPIEAAQMNQATVCANNPTTSHGSLSDSTQQPVEFASTWDPKLAQIVLSEYNPVPTTNDSELLYQAFDSFYVLSLKIVGDLFHFKGDFYYHKVNIDNFPWKELLDNIKESDHWQAGDMTSTLYWRFPLEPRFPNSCDLLCKVPTRLVESCRYMT